MEIQIRCEDVYGTTNNISASCVLDQVSTSVIHYPHFENFEMGSILDLRSVEFLKDRVMVRL